MGILIDALTEKYASQEPPLALAAGIRQTSDLDPETEMAFEGVDEMDKDILQRLGEREKDVLLTLNGGLFAFPCPTNDLVRAWPNRTDEQRQDQIDYQIAVGASAVEKYVLGELYEKAAKRNPAEYQARAYFFLGDKTTGKMGDADLTLARAEKSVLSMGQAPPTISQASNVMQTSLASQGEETQGDYDRRNLVLPYDRPDETVDFYAQPGWWQNR